MIFLMEKRHRVILTLLLGLLFSLLLHRFLKTKERELNQRYQLARVVVAREYIPIGKRLTLDLLEEKEIPALAIQPKAVLSLNDVMREANQPKFQTRIELLKGEQLTYSKLNEEGLLLGASWTLSPNRQAYTLRLDMEQAVGGFLQPGDYVSVYASTDKTQLVFKSIQVIGVQGDLFDPSMSIRTEKPTKSALTDVMYITLALKEEETSRLVEASSKGRISLALLSSFRTPPAGDGGRP